VATEAVVTAYVTIPRVVARDQIVYVMGVRYRYLDAAGHEHDGRCETGDEASAVPAYEPVPAGLQPEDVQKVRIRYRQDRPDESCLADKVPTSRQGPFFVMGVAVLIGLASVGYGLYCLIQGRS
jgi:hypothetical protein